jgi:hypothetical protein
MFNNFIKAHYRTPIIMTSEANAISKLKKLLESNCIIEKVQPSVRPCKPHYYYVFSIHM